MNSFNRKKHYRQLRSKLVKESKRQNIGNFQSVLVQFSSVQSSRLVVSDSLRPHELQHARPPCPSPTPGVHSNSCPSSWWCHPAISSSVIPFSSCPQSLPASESFPMSQLFSWGGLRWIQLQKLGSKRRRLTKLLATTQISCQPFYAKTIITRGVLRNLLHLIHFNETKLFSFYGCFHSDSMAGIVRKDIAGTEQPWLQNTLRALLTPPEAVEHSKVLHPAFTPSLLRWSQAYIVVWCFTQKPFSPCPIFSHTNISLIKSLHV